MNEQEQGKSKLDAELEAEIAAALGDDSIESLMSAGDEPPAKAPPRIAKPAPAEPQKGQPGQKGQRRGRREPEQVDRSRLGRVLGTHKGEVMVEFGAKEQGVCPIEHFKEPPKPGDELEFIVGQVLEEGLWQLSIRGESVKVNWDSVEQDMVVEATVTGSNKGGLELMVTNHKAFMPISQIDLRRVEDLTPFVGTKMRCQVVELDKEKGRIVLSRRNVLVVEQAAEKERVFRELQVGDMVDGTVRRIEKFGAFVEIAPGVDGLIHVSDMSYQRVEDPHSVVKVDQPVRVQVLKIDAEAGRIGLGLKQTGVDPWQNIDERYQVGTNHIGKITRTAAFGAFVELEPGVEGLIHIGQISDKRIDRPDQVVKIGQDVTVKVMEVDALKRRIGLSMKALKEDETGEKPSEDDLRRYIRKEGKPGQSRAVEGLMAKFGGGGMKGGIG
jgi:ribosomal protein S1